MTKVMGIYNCFILNNDKCYRLLKIGVNKYQVNEIDLLTNIRKPIEVYFENTSQYIKWLREQENVHK